MEEETVKLHQEKIKNLLDEKLLPLLIQPCDKLESMVDQYISEIEFFFQNLSQSPEKRDKIKMYHEHIQFRKKVLYLLDRGVRDSGNDELTSQLSDFENAFILFKKQLPVFWYSEQGVHRFRVLDTDTRTIRIIKLIKTTGYAIDIAPRRFHNLLLKIFRRPLKPLKPWKQNIPLHKLTDYYFYNIFLERTSHLADNSHKQATLTAFQIWKYDELFFRKFSEFMNSNELPYESLDHWKEHILADLHKYKESIGDFRVQANDLFVKEFRDVSQLFESQVSIAGTLEFSSRKHANYLIRTKRKKLIKSFIKQIGYRGNTLFALADDWKFNQEIYILQDNAKKTGLQFQIKLHSKGEIVGKSWPMALAFLQATEKEIHSQTLDELRNNLIQQKHLAVNNFQKKLIPEISNLLGEQSFPLLIDETEQNLFSEMGFMAEKRVLMPDFDPEKAYENKALHPTSPIELLNFEMMTRLKEVSHDSKIRSMQKLEAFHVALEELGGMIVYNLDSAIALIDQQGKDGIQDCTIDVKASIERGARKIKELESQFIAFINTLDKDFENAIEKFYFSVGELTDNTKVEQIRFRITKARALKKSEQIKALILEKYKILLATSLRMYSSSTNEVNKGIAVVRRHLGIHDVITGISTELSDFLLTSEPTLRRLPFVYKRLFINEPLRETTFYFKRVAENQLLDQTYQRWQNGAFVPSLVVGEKGSGISTFIQMFVKETIQRKPIVFSVLLHKRIISEEDLLALLGQSFRGEAFEKLHDFFEFVDKQEPFVAFVDKLQLLYLRQTGGFNTLKKFFEMVSVTSKKVFWICTCSLYASIYLNKSIGLYSYFPVIIRMKDLTVDEVVRVIMLRHKASGYDLKFEASADDLQNRTFLKKAAEEKQDFLMKSYFASLNRLTRSNISFALQLWLRSADRLQDNTIHLISLNSINFEFIRNLPAEEIFGIYAVMIHEKLDVFQLSQVLNISRRQAYLMLMRFSDRGIIKEDQGLYSVHPLLYRQFIELLLEKNFLY